MLVDLLSPADYIMVNRDAIRILGLNTAVYCSELLNIYKKVVNKKKFINDDKYFEVDRTYIEKQTSLNLEDQLKCDINLSKVNIIKVDPIDKDAVYFDVEIFASVLASEDIKLQEQVAKKVKVENPKGVKSTRQARIVNELKNSIECNTPQVLFAMKDWIDAITANRSLSKCQVKIFKDMIDEYCDGDLQKALDIIKLATIHEYVDCQWAINLYEKGNKPSTTGGSRTNNSSTRVTEQKKTFEISNEIF